MDEWSLEGKNTEIDEENGSIFSSRPRSGFIVSIIVLVLMILVSAGGLVIENIYQDIEVIQEGWLGNALISLFIAVPLLAGSMIFSWRGSERAKLLWMGMLYFTLCNYTFYLFGAAFNYLFPFYVGIVILSALGLMLSFKSIDEKKVSRLLRHNLPIKWMGVFIAGVVIVLLVFSSWIYLEFFFTGALPGIVLGTPDMTKMVSTVNLLFIIPLGFASAFWIWDRNPWGHVLSIVWNVNLMVYTAALSSSTLFAFKTGELGNLNELGLWMSIAIACLIVVVILLDRMGGKS
ncbi:MAG: hypothetical protein KGY66_04255 [Candidatus Thermoplasmatota archaeon]|nr:hypothetical protein [Candidatus Thermoplasmatota archaeon]MBS3790110.1 hypothetical protein [Candidatus Thermoplasmatota archaeon]